MKKIFFSLIALGFAAGAFAQTTISPVMPSYKKRASLGLNFFLKDMITAERLERNSVAYTLDRHDWARPSEMSPGVSLSYYNGLADHVDFTAGLGATYTKYPFSVPSGVAASTTEKFLLEASAGINVKLMTDNYFINPYFHIGIGASMYKGTYFAAYMPTALGLQFNLGGGSFLHTTFNYNYKVSSLAVNNLSYSIGFSAPLKDEVKPPVVVAPPPPPAPAPEKDTDGDGIVDSKDKCPEVAGAAKYDGCPVPDTDGDGINDDNDKCPTVKGLPKYNGCPIPDRDKDGINDDEDKCPDVPGVARYQGCPVPDRDKDGINDEEDKCPDVPGVRENNGCPLVKEEVVKKVNTSAKNIFFQTGKATLLPKSFKALNDVVAVLNEDANLKLDIEGHTDITGGDKINIPLSKARAQAVYDYMVSKGISASRLSSEGFGSSQPIADNKTAAGRALNRRTNMKLKYY